MNFWNKLSKEPTCCSFHDDSLRMLDLRKDCIHLRIALSESTYLLFEDELRDVYHDPRSKELYFDMLFLNATVKDSSYLPEQVAFDEDYSILAMRSDDDGGIALSFVRLSAPEDYFHLDFTYKKCIVKPFGEYDSAYYDAHPEIFDLPFDFDGFVSR